MEKRRTVYSIKDVLPEVIAHISSDTLSDQIKLDKAWQEIAGRETGKSVVSGSRNGSVFVTVDSPARLYQWKIRRQAVLRKLQETCPSVQNVVFKIGKVV